ncbi:MAG: hypothetical protein ICV87_03390 [Gemmatimonadetes bacterium]|nr:hypothetical protein [Gemmatimonadota bacterium]
MIPLMGASAVANARTPRVGTERAEPRRIHSRQKRRIQEELAARAFAGSAGQECRGEVAVHVLHLLPRRKRFRQPEVRRHVSGERKPRTPYRGHRRIVRAGAGPPAVDLDPIVTGGPLAGYQRPDSGRLRRRLRVDRRAGDDPLPAHHYGLPRHRAVRVHGQERYIYERDGRIRASLGLEFRCRRGQGQCEREGVGQADAGRMIGYSARCGHIRLAEWCIPGACQ